MTLFVRRPVLPASFIEGQLLIRGELTTYGTIRIDDSMEGSVRCADMGLVDPSGVILGDIDPRELIVAGTIHGSLSARARDEVQASARIHGDVRASALAQHARGVVHGSLCIEGDDARDDIRAPHVEIGTHCAVPALQG